VVLDRLPLTANGKLDRPALVETYLARIRRDTASILSPRTSLEQKLVEIACRVLGLAEISVEREFLALGADSVKLVELAAALEKELGHRVDLVDAFQYPTVRKLATHLAQRSAHPTGVVAGGVVEAAQRRAASRRNALGRIDPAGAGHDEK
jgi:acyl carrier protein